MFLDDKKFYQTVWLLAHNWVNADPNETNITAISTELKDAIHRLMYAIFKKDISARTRFRSFFMDDSIISLVADSSHQKKFELCLKQDKFDKDYLDSIYVKRYEILDWCARVYCDPPPCWVSTKLSDEQVIGNETKNHQLLEVNTNTTQQREAAHIKHEPIENLKKECILFWLQHKGYSNNHAARKFYGQLSQEKKRLLKSSNAERTLSNAISQYRNRENLLENDKFPHWLKNFTPENP